MLSVISKAITKLKPAGSAAAGDVKSGKTFYNTTTKEIRTGTFAAQSKTVTAGTSNVSVSPDSGKYLSSVTVQPTPSQSKTVTPSTSAQTITPDSGKYLSSVSVAAIPTNFKYASAINQDPGKRTTGEISVDTASRKYFITAYNGSYGIDGYNGTSWVTDIVTGSTDGSSSGASNNPVSVKSGTLSGYVKYRGWINPYNNGRNGSIGIAIGI